MKRNHIIFLFLLFAGTTVVKAQYTETINSNRPGNSQGAFAVGTDVIQIETGITFGNDQHSLLNTDSDRYGLEYALRYGFWKEQLEVSLIGSFLYQSTLEYRGGTETEYVVSNFDNNTLGAKYLLYDPYKNPDEINIRSWKANRKFSFKKLIPAVSAYAGVNIMLGDNPYKVDPNDGIFTPRAALITQNNWGRWVFVTNIIGDNFLGDFPTYAGIFTMTHSVNPNLALFGEYQIIKSDIYSDNIARAGGAYLFSQNFQVDISGLVNYKDTPSRWQVAAGVSYRLDLHSEDVLIEDRRAKRIREKEEKRMEEVYQ